MSPEIQVMRPVSQIRIARMRRFLALLSVVAIAALVVSPVATASRHTRSCGFLTCGIGWNLRATPNLSCSRARTIFKACFVSYNGSKSRARHDFDARSEATGRPVSPPKRAYEDAKK